MLIFTIHFDLILLLLVQAYQCVRILQLLKSFFRAFCHLVELSKIVFRARVRLERFVSLNTFDVLNKIYLPSNIVRTILWFTACIIENTNRNFEALVFQIELFGRVVKVCVDC